MPMDFKMKKDKELFKESNKDKDFLVGRAKPYKKMMKDKMY